ncbi:rCG58331 [Rattus norvegicus]|uniref:RCG58331 n=1 Tax=Rattus norvegicus TaxID=10116 RepID=A6J4V9_RAT|nr:rCG58331 [Rattus norvegicus]
MAHSSPPAQDSQAAGVVHLPSMCKAGREGGRGK